MRRALALARLLARHGRLRRPALRLGRALVRRRLRRTALLGGGRGRRRRRG
jgi:hypothetical protein